MRWFLEKKNAKFIRTDDDKKQQSESLDDGQEGLEMVREFEVVSEKYLSNTNTGDQRGNGGTEWPYSTQQQNP